MASRRKYLKQSLSDTKSSIAGTARHVTGSVKDKVKKIAKKDDSLPNVPADERRKYQDKREEAEADRIKKEAKQEGKKRAREQFREEYRKQMEEKYEKQEKQKLEQKSEGGGTVKGTLSAADRFVFGTRGEGGEGDMDMGALVFGTGNGEGGEGPNPAGALVGSGGRGRNPFGANEDEAENGGLDPDGFAAALGGTKSSDEEEPPWGGL